MARTNTKWTTKELYDLWVMVEDKEMTFSQVSSNLGRTSHAVMAQHSAISRELRGEKEPNRSHLRALKRIEAHKDSGDQSQTRTVVVRKVDYYEALTIAQESMNQAIVSVIKNEVSRKVNGVMEENEQLKKKVEGLEKIAGEAKKSNITTNLRRHFGGY